MTFSYLPQITCDWTGCDGSIAVTGRFASDAIERAAKSAGWVAVRVTDRNTPTGHDRRDYCPDHAAAAQPERP